MYIGSSSVPVFHDFLIICLRYITSFYGYKPKTTSTFCTWFEYHFKTNFGPAGSTFLFNGFYMFLNKQTTCVINSELFIFISLVFGAQKVPYFCSLKSFFRSRDVQSFTKALNHRQGSCDLLHCCANHLSRVESRVVFLDDPGRSEQKWRRMKSTSWGRSGFTQPMINGLVCWGKS